MAFRWRVDSGQEIYTYMIADNNRLTLTIGRFSLLEVDVFRVLILSNQKHELNSWSDNNT